MEFSGLKSGFESLGAVVAGVSPDSLLSHEKSRQKHNISVWLLSDPGHVTIGAYGAWGSKNASGKESFGVIRSTVLIDSEGIVRVHWPKAKARGHAAQVLESLRKMSAQNE